MNLENETKQELIKLIAKQGAYIESAKFELNRRDKTIMEYQDKHKVFEKEIDVREKEVARLNSYVCELTNEKKLFMAVIERLLRND
jgi:uncharacterized protein (DUF3084 family)